jgi:dolichyl-phosphate-mannose-protein mannosyltransferase
VELTGPIIAGTWISGHVEFTVVTVDAGSDRETHDEPISRTATGHLVPSVRERFLPLARFEDRVGGWFSAIAVFLLALFLRLWKLGTPDEFAFDETYYAKDAWSLLHHGYIRHYVPKADEKILGGQTTGLWLDDPSMTVHPEVGKWMIALGEKAFGLDPFGWRVMSAVVGSLMVLMLCRLVRRLTGSTMLGCVAGLLLCFDGMHLVLSRLALLDIILAFWVLAAAQCLVIDRDWTRARFAQRDTVKRHSDDRPSDDWGPRLWWRPWLALSGVCFGLACGTKWSAIFPLAAFGVLVWAWNAGARRALGVRRPVLRSTLLDGVPAFVHLVLVAFVVYVASWTGWLLHAHQYEEHLSSTQYTRFVSWDGECNTKKHSVTGVKYDDDARWSTAKEPDARGLGEVKQSLTSLWLYHQDVYRFHTTFLNCSEHVYSSDPGGWPLLSRPVGVNVVNDIQPGTQGCEAPQGSSCIREVLLLGTPVLWWGGALAMMYAVVAWLARRDWRYGFAVIGMLSLWLPWQSNDQRPIFVFYASAFLPFTIIGLTLVMGEILGRAPAASPRRTVGTIITGSFFVLVLLNFAWFWPIWTNGLITHGEWLDRIWFARWI